jgi:FkbH-like protein
MYETEANIKKESLEQIPSEIATQFRELTDTITQRTVLPWSEHCTECVWPTCYSTCDLYSPRADGRCRRFSDGMVRIDCPESPNSYILKIRFKRWGKLWTPGNTMLRTMHNAMRIERRDYRIGSALYQLPLPRSVKSLASQKRYSLKKRMARQESTGEMPPTSFVLECYNPSAEALQLSLTMRSAEDRVKVPFQKLIELNPGFHRVRIPYGEITKFLDLQTPFSIDLVPNERGADAALYFGMMEFVRETPTMSQEASAEENPERADKIKCVVWDLDNTIWDGTLVEDGPEKLKLKPRIVQILKTLDERGILHSVVSKNNRNEALGVLRAFGIEEYFLCPQISWRPKSEGLQAIARGLNIGIDSLLFVDDSEFELQQVKTIYPAVRVLNADRYMQIEGAEVCQVPITTEGRERRKMYQVESERQAIVENFGEDYTAFLRYCNIRLSIRPMTEGNLDRVHELTQRTNQMNFSGNRYQRNMLESILNTPHLETHVLDVEDRFGSYGTVGFCIVDSRMPLMTDLMFSCRVQSKRVEHALLAYIIRRYIATTGREFQANYRKTPRNAPAGQVFSDLGLEEISCDSGVSRLVFPKNQEIPDDGIIDVVVNDSVEAAR